MKRTGGPPAALLLTALLLIFAGGCGDSGRESGETAPAYGPVLKQYLEAKEKMDDLTSITKTMNLKLAAGVADGSIVDTTQRSLVRQSGSGAALEIEADVLIRRDGGRTALLDMKSWYRDGRYYMDAGKRNTAALSGPAVLKMLQAEDFLFAADTVREENEENGILSFVIDGTAAGPALGERLSYIWRPVNADTEITYNDVSWRVQLGEDGLITSSTLVFSANMIVDGKNEAIAYELSIVYSDADSTRIAFPEDLESWPAPESEF